MNNAAIVRPSLLVSAGDEDIEAVVRTNILGTIACTRAALGRMLAQRRGVILNIGSVAASSPCRGQAVYAATKAAVETLAARGRRGVLTQGHPLRVPCARSRGHRDARAHACDCGDRIGSGDLPLAVSRHAESVAENIVARLAARRPPAPSRTDASRRMRFTS